MERNCKNDKLIHSVSPKSDREYVEMHREISRLRKEVEALSTLFADAHLTKLAVQRDNYFVAEEKDRAINVIRAIRGLLLSDETKSRLVKDERSELERLIELVL